MIQIRKKIIANCLSFLKWLLNVFINGFCLFRQYFQIRKLLGEENRIDLKRLIQNLVVSYMKTQQIIDKGNLSLIRELSNLNNKGFSVLDNRFISVSKKTIDDTTLPLSDMISFRKNYVQEMLFKFSVIEETKSIYGFNKQPLLTLLSFDSQLEHSKTAQIKISGNETVTAEFFIEGKVKATFSLSII